MATRFRAYKLGTEGAAFSYSTGNHFTLIEARLTDTMIPNISEELKLCGVVGRIDKLHITSWDNDHCLKSDLETILEHLKPKHIDSPGYIPKSENGIACKNLIDNYISKQTPPSTIQSYNPTYINGLENGSNWNTNNIIYNPRTIDANNNNNNSTVMLFRGGSFNIASMGDVESSEIAKTLINSPILKKEVDVLILPHHGADNGFTTPEFLAAINPSITISASNYGNKYEHPRPIIQARCEAQGSFFATTKRGDVLVIETDINHFTVQDLYKDSERVWKEENFVRKESRPRV